MSPAELIQPPEAVSRAALITEVALFESLSREPLDIDSLRKPFVERLTELGARRPVYSRFAWSLDEYVLEHIRDGLLEQRNDGALLLTPSGSQELAALRRRL